MRNETLHARTIKNTSTATVLTLFALLAAGCGSGLGPTAATVQPTGTGAHISGHVHGGQQPVSGATIQLYAAGIGGIQSAATPLIATTVTTNGSGGFNITGDWNCTSNTAAYGTNPQLYIVATGGNPGAAAGTNNTALAIMAALGPCSGVTASTDIEINELTTVAAVYSLAPFMADIAHVGAQSASALGLVNAFTTANLLANTVSGSVPGNLPANATAPVSELNTLADAIAACVNSTGVGGACAMLFAAAAPPGGNAPTNTIAALLNISRNPAANVPTILGMASPTSPFQPILASAPNDWTVALNFTGGGLYGPAAIAIDPGGNAWVANAGGNSVTELSSSGTLLTGATGYTGSNNLFGAQGIAIDRAGNVWVADTLLSSVVELTLAAGVIQSSTTFTAGGISGPTALAIDSQNNVWIANFAGGSITELNSTGSAVGASPLTANGTLQSPIAIAVDAAGNVWATDNSASNVVVFNQNQSLLSGSGYTGPAMLAPIGIALDSSGRAWIADSGTNAVSLLGPSGSPATTAYMNGGLALPAAVALDGLGTAWIANSQTAGSLSVLSASQGAPLSPAAGLGVFNQPQGIAVDPSGNVWTANAGDNSVSEVIGAASPATAPLALQAGP